MRHPLLGLLHLLIVSVSFVKVMAASFGITTATTSAQHLSRRSLPRLSLWGKQKNNLQHQYSSAGCFHHYHYCQRPKWKNTLSRRCLSSVNNGSGNGEVVKGDIMIYNEQDSLDDGTLKIKDLEETISHIRSELGYDEYAVTLVLTTDEEMQQTNHEQRSVNAPTDILSWPFHPHDVPGTIIEPTLPIPDLYTLGDMMIDVPYVMRRCQEDMMDTATQKGQEVVVERGVSGAMASIEDPVVRIHMLLIHGMLHLVGYDHIEDDDFELMVTREEELLRKLQLDHPTTK
mmetsp:Transcript_25446/g.35828  ORF Transcript_25446/g.35828 Transcript_25446/m.35828 type:complete len:287 (+) Transcript_25446:91-951(+)